MKSYIVIGLGKFGTEAAKRLCEYGCEVLAIDRNPELVQPISNLVTQAVVGDARDKEVLRALGAKDFECAIVAIGYNLADSVLATMNLKELGVPCYYRVGSKGAYMIMNGEVEFVPVVHLVPKEEEVDPTGCGNSSTAAALWAFCEGMTTKEICAWGNIVAAHNVLQFGPTKVINQAKRDEAMAYLKKLCSEE